MPARCRRYEVRATRLPVEDYTPTIPCLSRGKMGWSNLSYIVRWFTSIKMSPFWGSEGMAGRGLVTLLYTHSSLIAGEPGGLREEVFALREAGGLDPGGAGVPCGCLGVAGEFQRMCVNGVQGAMIGEAGVRLEDAGIGG